MATTTTWNIMTSGNLWEFIQREAIRNFEAALFFKQTGKIVSLPFGMNKYTFPTVDNKDGAAIQLTEGVTPTETAFTLTNVEVTLAQYGSFALLSDVVMTDSPVNAVQEAAFELGRDLANKADAVIQDAIDGGTNVIYGGAATSRVTVAAGSTMTAAKLAEATSRLKTNDAPFFDGMAYVAIMHPDVAYDLQQESGTGTFIDLNKYTDSNARKPLKGEMGMLFGARVVASSNVQFFADAGVGWTVDVYPTYVVGRNAYATVMAGGMETFINGLGSEGSADPLHQRLSVGGKVRLASAILKNEALYRIETSSSLGANV